MNGTMGGYTQVKVPTELVQEIDKRVGTMGYKSRQEFVRDAIRRRLDQFILRQTYDFTDIETEVKESG